MLFLATGNEFSLFMLMGSNFVLNKSKGKDSNTIYPWVSSYELMRKRLTYNVAIKLFSSLQVHQYTNNVSTHFRSN